MSFANQALCSEYLVQRHTSLKPDVYDVPREIDDEVARLKLAAMGVSIDTLTDRPMQSLPSCELGTQ